MPTPPNGDEDQRLPPDAPSPATSSSSSSSSSSPSSPPPPASSSSTSPPPSYSTGPGSGPAWSQQPPPPYDEPRDDSGLRGRLEGFLPDVIKRTFYAGVGALFTTEEGIRKMASEFQLPKDVVNYLINQAATSKDDLFRVVAKELRGFLEGVNLSGELRKLLTSLSFEVKTEIRFIPNDEAFGGVSPQVRPDVKVRRNEPQKRRKQPPRPRRPKKQDA